jgi:hypothetical protein
MRMSINRSHFAHFTTRKTPRPAARSA